jgi:hypothetical protein
MNIIPNYYEFLDRICWACGFPIISGSKEIKRTRRAECCQPSEPGERTSCQTARNNYNQKMARLRYKKIGKKKPVLVENSQQAMRECLRCEDDPLTGVIPKFLSKGPFNRICEPCSNKLETIDVSNLSGIGDKIEGFEFNPTMI